MGCLSKETVTMVHESSSLSQFGSQCCGHVQVLACDYCHVVYHVEREGVVWFVSSQATVKDTGVVHCSVGAMLSLAHAVICTDC